LLLFLLHIARILRSTVFCTESSAELRVLEKEICFRGKGSIISAGGFPALAGKTANGNLDLEYGRTF
jgi:hypothetical protein